MKNIFLFVFLLTSYIIKGQIITTVVGNGNIGAVFEGDNGPAFNDSIGRPGFIVFDDSNNYYFTDGLFTIRKVSNTGIITTVAGNGTSGCSGNGGLATNAQVLPTCIAVDKFNNLYFTDGSCLQIRKVDMNTGIITNFAGTGAVGYNGDTGLATNAKLNYPYGICTDSFGNVYFADRYNHRIRKIDLGGYISTYAGNGIGAISGDSDLATNASINLVNGICSDKQNNIYICDVNRTRKITYATGIITTVAGGGGLGDGHQADSAYVIPDDIAVDRVGNIYITETSTISDIRKVDLYGIISTIAGTGILGYNGDSILAVTSELNYPEGIAVDSCGNVFFCDDQNVRVRKITFDSCLHIPAKLNEVRETKNYLNIYPNPAENIININNINYNSIIDKIEIISILGKTLITQSSNTKSQQIKYNSATTRYLFCAGKWCRDGPVCEV